MIIKGKSGGSAWESNPPGKFLTPHTGFEDRAAHQRLTRFRVRIIYIGLRKSMIILSSIILQRDRAHLRFKIPPERSMHFSLPISPAKEILPLAVEKRN